MPARTLNYGGLTAANPYTIGGAPDNITGYGLGGNPAKITFLGGSNQYNLASGAQSQWYDDTNLTGNVISCYVKIGTTNGSACGPALVNKTTGNGFVALTSDTTSNIRMFLISAWSLGAQVGSSIAQAHVTDQVRGLTLDKTTNIATVTVNGVPSATTFDMTPYSSYNVDRAAALSRGGYMKELTSEFTAAQTITSINSGNPVAVGQSGVVIAHTGFTGAVSSVTTNRSGVTCAITAGDANSTTVTVSGWVEGGAYPVVDNTVTFTCTRGAESASATQTLTKPANYAQVTFSGAITDDPNLIGYHLAANGHTVEGGTFYPRTDQVTSLTVNADTSWTCDPAGGTFSATFIPSSGATSGNAYLFDITLLNGSIVSVQGLTSVGLTSVGLTQIGLTSVGLC